MTLKIVSLFCFSRFREIGEIERGEKGESEVKGEVCFSSYWLDGKLGRKVSEERKNH